MTSTTTGNSMPDTGNNKADLVGQGSGVGSALSGGRNVSVTPINMSDTQFNNGQFSYSSNGIRISVPSEEQRRMGGNISIEDEDSNDAEVSKIDFSQHPYQVNMRTKKKRPSSSTLSFNADGQSQDNGTVGSDRDRERPMSWEGELSDSEMLVDSNPSGTPDALHGTNKTPHSDLEFRLGPQKEGNGYCLKTEPIERDNSFAAANRHNSVSFQSLNDHDALNLKYGNSHHPMLQAHQRSHSMNRVSILSNDNNLDIKSSSLLQQKSTQENIDDENPSEPIIKNMPVNIIPKTLSNKMASEAQAYAAKRELMQQTNISEIKPELPCLVDKFLGGYSLHSTPSNSPLLNRHHKIVSNPSTDSAIHSVYTHSVYSSPSASPGATRHAQYTPSLSRNNSDASHSSCYSYSSEFSPTHSPVQSRHPIPSHPAAHHLFRSEHGAFARQTSTTTSSGPLEGCIEGGAGSPDPEGSDDRMHHHQGVSRQQLINSPCPICGDKISGFHYGIFSCESCKGFFKRTVQNRKNYVCLRGANCPVTVATRKKCPACRFDKCLHCGMKLEAIREDRTRGGRSTYQCSYTLSSAASTSSLLGTGLQSGPLRHASSLTSVNGPSSHLSYHSHHDLHSASLNSMQLPLSRLAQSGVKSEPGSHVSQAENIGVPPLLQEIMDVEHLWQYNESELTRLNKGQPVGTSTMAPNPANNPLLHAAGVPADASPDFLSNLCNIADHRLYKIVKWCKSLPLFKNISIDDQICLLINSWCELLVLSCCYRGVSTPGEVRVGGGNRGITLQQSAKMGLTPCIERMLHFTDHLRRLRVDRYEYVAMKVIVLLNSDTSDLKEPEKVRASQEKALQALQAYTLAHYHETPAKFGELLLRIPELQKTCQVGKEMLNPSNKTKDGDTSSFNLLMELLRGDH